MLSFNKFKNTYISSELDIKFLIAITVISIFSSLISAITSALVNFDTFVVTISIFICFYAYLVLSHIIKGLYTEIDGFILALVLSICATPLLFYKQGGTNGAIMLFALADVVIYSIILNKKDLIRIIIINLLLWPIMIYSELHYPDMVKSFCNTY